MGAQKCLSLKHYCMSLGHIIVTIFLHNVLFGKRTHPIISNPLQSDILQLSMSNVSASAKGLKAALTMTTATYHWTSIFWCLSRPSRFTARCAPPLMNHSWRLEDSFLESPSILKKGLPFSLKQKTQTHKSHYIFRISVS